MTVEPMTLKAINQRNCEFWESEKGLMKSRMADDAVREIAWEALAAEATKGLPVYYQKSLYEALADAESAKRRFIADRASKAGSARKGDTLQTLIEEFVRDHPTIRELELQGKLIAHEGVDPIQEIDEGIVFFTDRRGITKEANLSGLKDRLSRAKKKIQSR
jgi:hypothetical protein